MLFPKTVFKNDTSTCIPRKPSVLAHLISTPMSTSLPNVTNHSVLIIILHLRNFFAIKEGGCVAVVLRQQLQRDHSFILKTLCSSPSQEWRVRGRLIFLTHFLCFVFSNELFNLHPCLVQSSKKATSH